MDVDGFGSLKQQNYKYSVGYGRINKDQLGLAGICIYILYIIYLSIFFIYLIHFMIYLFSFIYT